MLFGAVCLALGYGLASSNRQAQSGVVVQQEQVGKNDRGTGEQTHNQSIKQQGAASGTAAAAATGTGSGSTRVGGIKTVCEDTCPGHANNGVCDDGRPSLSSKEKVEQAAISLVLCDLGTDCGDCGPWVHTNTDEADSWRPIQEIRAKNVSRLHEGYTLFVAAPPRHCSCAWLAAACPSAGAALGWWARSCPPFNSLLGCVCSAVSCYVPPSHQAAQCTPPLPTRTLLHFPHLPANP